MDFVYWIIFPWKNIDIAEVPLFISVGVFDLFLIYVIIVGINKKARRLSYVCYMAYFAIFCETLLFMFGLLWYVSIPLSILITILIYKSTIKDVSKVRNEELEGGFCCNEKSRKQQTMEFELKSSQERQEYLDYCNNHPVEIKPTIVLICFVLPILITLLLWRLGVGYRWYGYSLLQY